MTTVSSMLIRSLLGVTQARILSLRYHHTLEPVYILKGGIDLMPFLGSF